MMHGSEWTLKCDEPEVENVERGLNIYIYLANPCFGGKASLD